MSEREFCRRHDFNQSRFSNFMSGKTGGYTDKIIAYAQAAGLKMFLVEPLKETDLDKIEKYFDSPEEYEQSLKEKEDAKNKRSNQEKTQS